jgi:hypothetical protein
MACRSVNQSSPAIDVNPRKIMKHFLIGGSWLVRRCARHLVTEHCFAGDFNQCLWESSLSSGRKTALISKECTAIQSRHCLRIIVHPEKKMAIDDANGAVSFQISIRSSPPDQVHQGNDNHLILYGSKATARAPLIVLSLWSIVFIHCRRFVIVADVTILAFSRGRSQKCDLLHCDQVCQWDKNITRTDKVQRRLDAAVINSELFFQCYLMFLRYLRRL